MRKSNVKPGVVYAYQRWGMHPTDTVEPLVFLSSYTWIGDLRQTTPDRSAQAFKRPKPGRKPQAGTVYNDGTIGYPAVLGPIKPTEDDLAKLKSYSLRDLDAADSAYIDSRFQFTLVTSMKRVAREWES